MDSNRKAQYLELYQLHLDLKARSYKSRELAKELEFYPSAYSVFVNKILKPIHDINSLNEKESIDDKRLFERTPNLSYRKIIQNLANYIAIFKDLANDLENKLEKSEENFINDLIAKTPMESLQVFEGIYDCYYLSSFGYRMKCEPFMIKYDRKKGCFLARKGNRTSMTSYLGIAYISNSQILTVQLQERGTFTPDHFIINLHIPITYSQTIDIVQGIAVSLANNKMPIARRVILERKELPITMEAYSSCKSTFYEDNNTSNNEIVRHLSNIPNMIDFVNIPYPTYTIKDLNKEEEIRNLALNQT